MANRMDAKRLALLHQPPCPVFERRGVFSFHPASTGARPLCGMAILFSTMPMHTYILPS